MRKWFYAVVAVVVSVSAASLHAWDTDNTVDVSLAYRQDNQAWSFKSPSPDPSLKSRVSLDEIHILDLGLNFRTFVQNCAYLRGRVNWGWVLDGDFREKFTELVEQDKLALVQDTRRTTATSLVDGRYTADLDIAIGYPFQFCDCSLRFIPLVGYGYHEQNYRFEENNRILFEETIPVPPAPQQNVGRQIIVIDNRSSDTKYISRWWGLFVGFDIDYNPSACWNFYSQFEFHFGNFKGQRYSKIGLDEFDDFRKSTHHAHGFYMKIGFDYDLCNCWTLGFFGTYEDFSAHKSSSTKVFELVDIAPTIIPIQIAHKLRFKAKRHGYSFGFQVGREF